MFEVRVYYIQDNVRHHIDTRLYNSIDDTLEYIDVIKGIDNVYANIIERDNIYTCNFDSLSFVESEESKLEIESLIFNAIGSFLIGFIITLLICALLKALNII